MREEPAENGREPARPVRRAALGVGVTALFFGAYFAIGHAVETHRTLATPLDAAIPFVPASIAVYAGVYGLMLYPLFTVRSGAWLRRTVAAYALVIAVCLVTFAVWPVSGAALRAPADAIDPTRFTGWGVALCYALDPPFNLFPSAHVAIALVAALAAWRVRSPGSGLALAAVAGVAVSTCTTKQHYVLDVVAGAVLGGVAYAVLLRRGTVGPADAFGARGPVTWLARQVLLYGALYAAFRAGVAV